MNRASLTSQMRSDSEVKPVINQLHSVSYMFDIDKYYVNPLAYLVNKAGLFLLITVVMLSGCSSQKLLVDQSVRLKCAPENELYTENDIKKQQLMKDCSLQGIINIVEEYNIDSDARSLFNEAVVLLENDKYREAVDILKQVVRKEQKFTAPYLNLGIAYFRLEKLKKAEKNFSKVLKLNAVHPVANNELGMLYRKTGRYAEARERYETLLTVYPGYMPARRNLGMLCDIYLQDLKCAKQQYDIYLKDDPADEQVKNWSLDLKSRM